LCPLRFLDLISKSPRPLKSQYAAEDLWSEANLSSENLAEPPLAHSDLSGDIADRSARTIWAKCIQCNCYREVPFSIATQTVREHLFHDLKSLSRRADCTQAFPKLKS
jgi:hypothetical protein